MALTRSTTARRRKATTLGQRQDRLTRTHSSQITQQAPRLVQTNGSSTESHPLFRKKDKVRQAHSIIFYIESSSHSNNCGIKSDHGVLGFWGFGVLGLGFRV